jgi:DNA ligase 1
MPLLSLNSPLNRRTLCIGLAAALAPAAAVRAAAATPGASTVASTKAPPLMLSRVYSPGLAVSDYWVSEKYDGVRGYWSGTQLLTRAGNAIAAPGWFTAGWPTTPMDGELWAGRGQFNQAVSTVRQEHADDAAWRAMRYMVFDLPAHGGPFVERLPALRAAVAALGQPWVVTVEQTQGTTAPALQARLDSVVQGGGEGLVLHQGAGRYVAGRSDTLRKLKPFDDAEARVVGHVAGRGKYAGKLGALWVEMPVAEGRTPRRFKLGSGLRDEERSAPPPVGTWVTYRFRGLTADGVPRFATYLRIAADRT